VNFLKIVSPFEQTKIVSEPGLASSVSTLADFLDRTGADAADGEPDVPRRLAEEALQAVLDAERRMSEQAARIHDLERLAMTDELTGLLNRRGFHAQLQRTVSASQRYDEEGLLVYVDLDGFKPINDTYGHEAGDKVLRRIAQLLVKNVRDTDYVGRLGGDEFAVLLTRTDLESGLKRAKSLEILANATFVSWRGRMIPVGASFGYQAYGPADDGREILRRADDAMYRTKRRRAGLNGRPAAQPLRAFA